MRFIVHLIRRNKKIYNWKLCLLPIAYCLLTWACAGGHSNRDPKFTQYYNQGEQLYLQHCSNCHQKNGRGLGRVYPPLDSSDFVASNRDRVICLMKNGIDGSIIVNGKEFNQKMPGVVTLTDLEIAEISTYIYNSWGRERGIVEVRKVAEVLRSCESKSNIE